MISKKMTAALNDQINAELYSAYLYVSMAGYASVNGYKGIANWMFVQAREEMTHAWRFYNYINSQGAQPIMAAIAKPPAKFNSPMHIFEETLKHEKVVTSRINNLVNVARQEKDHASEIFLQWFVTEQIEEEENANDILAELRMAGDKGGGLYMIDKELAARTFMMPPDLAGAAPA